MSKRLSQQDLTRAYRHFLHECLDDRYPKLDLGAESEEGGVASSCPGAETLWRLARLETTPEETREVLAHLLRCPRCAGHLQAIKAAQQPVRPGWRKWLKPAALAAGLVLVLSGIFFSQDDLRPGPDHVVSRGEEPEISSPLDGETMPLHQPFVLCWEGAPEGSLYSVWIKREDLAPVISESGLTVPRLTVGLDELPALVLGEMLLWRVVAETPAGEVIESPTFYLTFGPSPCCENQGETVEGLSK
ncbi:MAG: hypothetical protein AAF604_15460 [Acidobacteriota bacterium]